MDMRIPPLQVQMLLESNPLKSRMLVWRLPVRDTELAPPPHGAGVHGAYSAKHRSDLWPEVTLVFVPYGALQRPMNILFLIAGVSPRGPHRDKH